MKIKRILAFLAGMLIAISAFWITNQSEQVSASVFQKTTVPKKFRGTWYSCWGNGKVQPFKITRTEINLAGCADGGARVYKYTKRAYNAKGSSHLLIRTKGNAPHTVRHQLRTSLIAVKISMYLSLLGRIHIPRVNPQLKETIKPIEA